MGSLFQSAPRNPSGAAINRLAAFLGVSPSGQDWDIENADAARVEEFSETYDRLDLARDERFALMELIVASYDDRVRENTEAPGFDWIGAALSKDFAIHFHTVRYWSCLDHEIEDAFRVAPRMRAVYRSCTPELVLAAFENDESRLKMALSSGPGQEVRDDALFAAIEAGAARSVRHLLEAGARVTARDEGGNTPLIYAAADGRTDVAALLLDGGAEVDSEDGYRSTALSSATTNGHTETVRLLLAAGADWRRRDDKGYDALMLAAEYGRLELLEPLLAAGAIPGNQNTRGEDALAIAERHAVDWPDGAARLIVARLRNVR